MRLGVCISVLALLGTTTVHSFGQETLDDLGPKGPLTGLPAPLPRMDATTGQVATPSGTHLNGYFSDRIAYTLVNPQSPVSTRDVPSLLEIAEANAQVRVDLANAQHFAYADLSVLYQNGWLFYEDDGSGGRRSADRHDIPSLRPQVVPSELYLSSSPKPWLNVLVGKKRIVWGSGFAFNPMDLLNPPKDPTDPNYQRSGNWLLRIEAPFEKFTLTGLFAPQALYTQQGIPYAVLRFPSYPPSDAVDVRDQESHFLAAARLYLLLYDSDVNLVYYYSNHYQDDFGQKSRFGASFSRYVFTDYEIHFETLLSTGSSKLFPDHACATGTTSCDIEQAFASSKTGASTFYPRVIVGGRRQFSDESLLSLEYYYQADGYSDREFEDALRLLSGAPRTSGANLLTRTSSSGLPQRFTFEPLRRHYLMASYTKPRIRDDWTLGATLIAGLRDLSGVFSPSVAFSAREWLTLALYGYVPIRGLHVGEVQIANRDYSEYSIFPGDFRVLLEARAFYGD